MSWARNSKEQDGVGPDSIRNKSGAGRFKPRDLGAVMRSQVVGRDSDKLSLVMPRAKKSFLPDIKKKYTKSHHP